MASPLMFVIAYLSVKCSGKKSMFFQKMLLVLNKWIMLLFFSGYMSPEYAMRGQFSVKSDVFSFGVLVLEIVSGKKNTDFYQSNHADDLLSHVSNFPSSSSSLSTHFSVGEE